METAMGLCHSGIHLMRFNIHMPLSTIKILSESLVYVRRGHRIVARRLFIDC
jgi:hypothetical protein